MATYEKDVKGRNAPGALPIVQTATAGNALLVFTSAASKDVAMSCLYYESP